MLRRTTSLVFAGLLGVVTAASAQNTDAVPRFVVDIRGVTAGLPTSLGWTPVIPATTEVPSRGLGIDGGAHAIVLRGRTMSLGVGATFLIARSTTSTVTEPTTTAPNPAPLPDVETRLTVLAPQLSLNFGKRLGWSYISAGMGRGKVSSTATLTGSADAVNAVDEWTRTINFGGGARWFVNDHLGVGFDLRWHRLGAKEATTGTPLITAPRQTMLVLGIGISVR
jgi:hypothetical protein